MRRFTCISGTSSKFWEVSPPQQIDGHWAVFVQFGRIGTEGQSYTYLRDAQWQAHDLYEQKIREKLAKGYVEAGKTQVKKNVVNYTPDYVSVPKTVCKHDSLKRSGSTWTCVSCKAKVEFDKSMPVEEIETTVTKVKRFFDLRGRA